MRFKFEEFAGMFGLWADKFSKFIESSEMFNIYQQLKKDGQKTPILPSPDNTFKSFAKTSPKHIKVIWFLMDPYPKRYFGTKISQSTGIALDCSNTPNGKLQPSLELFYDQIEQHLDEKIERSPDLTYLLDQGIMLVNTDLTVKLGQSGSHMGLWEPFMKYFLEEVMGGTNGIIYVLSGTSSERMKKYINEIGNYIFKTEHPAFAARQKRAWNCDNIFSIIDDLLYKNQKVKIEWNKANLNNDLPF